jgi:plasmid stability protein
MTNVLVRDLPEETHHELLRRAEQRGQSLQQYLAAELTRLAASPTLDDVLQRIDARRGGRVGFAQAAADLSDERCRA